MQTLNMKAFKSKPENLQYGISPLHAWIRIFEFVLKLLGFKKWQVRNENDKSDFIAKKKHIPVRLRKEMGLHVDKPKQNGSGNSNDGNTVRRAFSNTKLFDYFRTTFKSA